MSDQAKKSKQSEKKTFVVIGAGAMGRITIRDLAETAPAGTTVVVGDYDLAAAKAAAKAYANKRGVTLKAVQVNALDVKKTAATLKSVKAFGVINAIQHQFNTYVMEAALAAGAHYTDLGGLFHYTRKQLKQHAAWKKAGKLAILGMGAAPGVVNIMARSVADELDEVHEIHIALGNVDRTVGRPSSALGTSYSLQTILEEASQPAAFFTGGEFTFVPAMSNAIAVDFPQPVGRKHPACTIHSEVATLPLSYKAKGIRECSFRIAFHDDLVGQLAFMRAVGLLGDKPVKVGKSSVVPRDLMVQLGKLMPKPPAWDGTPDEYEVLRVTVRGLKGGKKVEQLVDCHTPGIPEWKLGADVNTGCPPSIVMQMLARGDMDGTSGVLPPEQAVPPTPFFAELKKRHMDVRRPG